MRVRHSKCDWREFQEARAFARSLNLSKYGEWLEFCRAKMPRKGRLPNDIPETADRVYRNLGWLSWGDWLGTGAVATTRRRYGPFDEARTFVRSLNLSKAEQWHAYCKGLLPEKGARPADIPTNPQNTYRTQGWSTWGDWLGTSNVHPKKLVWREFGSARDFVRSLGLGCLNEWYTYCKGSRPNKGSRPVDIPSNPQDTYRDRGWTTWSDWLGTKNVHPTKMQWREFRSAREFVRSLGIVSWEEWRAYVRGELHGRELPADIPRLPGQAYRGKGWINWYDWLGTRRRH